MASTNSDQQDTLDSRAVSAAADTVITLAVGALLVMVLGMKAPLAVQGILAGLSMGTVVIFGGLASYRSFRDIVVRRSAETWRTYTGR